MQETVLFDEVSHVLQSIEMVASHSSLLNSGLVFSFEQVCLALIWHVTKTMGEKCSR